jgi:hypothetical protein
MHNGEISDLWDDEPEGGTTTGVGGRCIVPTQLEIQDHGSEIVFGGDRIYLLYITVRDDYPMSKEGSLHLLYIYRRHPYTTCTTSQ